MLITVLVCLQIILHMSCYTDIVQAEEKENKCFDCGDPLYLTPLIQQERFSEARQLSEVHYKDFHVPSYSGFFNVDKRFNSQMFFWYFPSLGSSDSPLVLWLEGGPGLTALLGVFYQNGPFQIINGTVTKRELAWNNDYHLLYLDNPVGTGLSHTEEDGYSVNQTGIAKNLYSALHQFLLLFSELQQKELYVFGTSYGAKYAVSLCDLIHRKNKNSPFQMNLEGFALFSAYMDPINQMDFAINLYNMGILDKHGYEDIHTLEEEVKQLIKEEKWFDAYARLYNSGELASLPVLMHKYTGFLGYYNILTPDDNIDHLYRNISYINDYIDTVRKPLHLGPTEVNGPYKVAVKLVTDSLQSVAPVLSEILNYYRGIVVSGQLDIIVSYPMLNNVLNKLQFSSSRDWRMTKRFHWSIEGELAGYYKTAGNLTEIVVLNAGHMIVTDQPERAYYILQLFTANQWKELLYI